MRHVNGHSFNPREVSVFAATVEDEPYELPPELAVNDPAAYRTIPLSPSTSCNIVAVDVSSLKIGETETGVLVAIRGAVVWKSKQGYQYVRCGPLTFHLKHGNEGECTFGSYSLGLSHMFTERAISRLRNLLERWIQKTICATFERAVILLDGSLTVGTPDNPAAYLTHILKEARERGNVVLAFSKSTRLCAFGRNITALVSRTSAPCVLDIDQAIAKQFESHPVRLAGHIYVAKLADDGFAFRLDADRQVSEEQRVDAVSRLISSDVVMQGYPETLRLAHIFSTFTANEVIAVQRYLALEYGLRVAPRFSIRKSLFGPFGTGWEAS
jgi:hypothetical protein